MPFTMRLTARRMCLRLCLTVLVASGPRLASAAPGDLDTTFAGFGSGGKVFTDGDTPYHPALRGMALQPDERIVVTSPTDFWPEVLRYLPNGALDMTFGGIEEAGIPGDGSKVISITTPGYLRSAAIQDDGRIVVAGRDGGGYGRFLLARLTSTGEMDAAFGDVGSVRTDLHPSENDSAAAVLVQPDGKIVACGVMHAGDPDFGVVRYNADGTLDPTFSGDGIQVIGFGEDESCSAIALLSDGDLVLVGTKSGSFLHESDFAVVRLNADGSLDTGFDHDGKLTTGFGYDRERASAVVIQPDGRILVAGSDPNNVCVARYLPDGTLDDTFDGDGKLSLGSLNEGLINDMALRPDGRIVLFGTHTSDPGGEEFVFYRLKSDGTLDTTFDGDGSLVLDMGGVDYGADIALQADGRMIAYGGSSGDHALVRLWPDGSLDTGGIQALGFEDPSFGLNSQEGATSLARQPDGKIVLAGYIEDQAGLDRNFALARFLPNGILDASFGIHGRVSFGFAGWETAEAVAVQPDGKIVVAGTSDTGNNANLMIARFKADGTPDSFGVLGFNLVDFLGDSDNGNALALAPDGKIVVAGLAYNGVNTVLAVARFKSNGFLDTDFHQDGRLTYEITPGATHKANAVVVLPDLKIVVAGNYIGGTPSDFALVRFNADGSVDSSFGTAGAVVTDFGANDSISDLVRLGDGSLLAAGLSRTGNANFALARYTASGALDTTFGTGGKVVVDFGGNDLGNALDVRGDGRIAVAGCSNDFFAVAQLLPNGSLDPAFKGSGKATTDLVGVKECAAGVQFDGPDTILAAGTQYVEGNRNMALVRYQTSRDATSSSTTSSTTSSSTSSSSTTSSTTSPSTSTSSTTSSTTSGSTSTSTSTTIPGEPWPDCSVAMASPAVLWPSTHRFAAVSIGGVTDPGGEPPPITITGIAQDERLGDGEEDNICPDATGLGTPNVNLRAERQGTGDGRVYRLSFRWDDGRGGQCTGTVMVCVPRDDAAQACVDQGPLADSTGPICVGACAGACAIERILSKPLCPGETVPAALVRRLDQARQSVSRAASAAGRRKAKRFMRRGMKTVRQAARMAKKATKRTQLSLACATSIASDFHEAKTGAGQWLRTR